MEDILQEGPRAKRICVFSEDRELSRTTELEEKQIDFIYVWSPFPRTTCGFQGLHPDGSKGTEMA